MNPKMSLSLPTAWLLLAVLVTSACQSAPRASSDLKNVFGENDPRVAMTKTNEKPWATIGMLSNWNPGSGGGCTATLIGRDLILTAAHCFFDEAVGRPRAHNGRFTTFWAGAQKSGGILYHNGNANVVGIVCSQKVIDGCPITAQPVDWAVARLDQPLGDRLGWLTMAKMAGPLKSGERVTLVGYSNDFLEGTTAGVHHNCLVRAVHGGVIHHDCAMAPGASGGPLLRYNEQRGEYEIVAINISQTENKGTVYKREYDPAFPNSATSVLNVEFDQ